MELEALPLERTQTKTNKSTHFARITLSIDFSKLYLKIAILHEAWLINQLDLIIDIYVRGP